MSLLLNKYGFTYLSYKSQYSFQTLRLFILFRILDPLMNNLFYAALAVSLIGHEYLSYLVLGNMVFYTGQTIMMNFMSMFRMERRYGTLELNIASPMSTILIITKKAIVPLLDGLFVFIINLLIGHFLFGISMHIDEVINLLLIFVVTLFSLLSFSMVFASVSLVFSNVNLFLNLSTSILHILCGANFSVGIFPPWLEFVARLLPLTHSIEAMRSIYRLENFAIYPLLFKELCIGIAYLIIAVALINIMEKVARRNGALFKSV
jgi:ABC-2 type transport system permease protein